MCDGQKNLNLNFWSHLQLYSFMTKIWNIPHQILEREAFLTKISNFSPVMASLGKFFGYGLMIGCEINSNKPLVMCDQQ